MIALPHYPTRVNIEKIITNANVNIERAEVLLTNLLALSSKTESCFNIPHDDVLVTIDTAIKILKDM